MRVTAMLAWYDEPVALLRQAVSSCAVFADRVLAVDGAYAQTPSGRPCSALRQATAIASAAADVGIDFEVLRPHSVWTGQVAKRSYMINMAAQDSDWVFPLDADWVIRGDRDKIRAELEASDCDEAEVQFFEPLNPDREVGGIPTHSWHKEYAGRTDWFPLIYRALDDMRCERSHWGYSGVKDGERIGLWGAKQWLPAGVVGRLRSDCLFEHRCLFRDDKRMIRNVAYIEKRTHEMSFMQGIEL